MSKRAYDLFGDAHRAALDAIDRGVERTPRKHDGRDRAARVAYGYAVLRLAAEQLANMAQREMAPKDYARLLRKVERDILGPLREVATPRTIEHAVGASIVAQALNAPHEANQAD